MKTTNHTKRILSKHSGFTLVEMMIIVCLIGMLAALCLPNYVRAVATSKRNECINNLRQLDSAVQQWVLENKKAPNSPVTLNDCTPYIKNGISCPAGGTTIFDSYSVSDGQSVPKCITSGGGAINGHFMTP